MGFLVIMENGDEIAIALDRLISVEFRDRQSKAFILVDGGSDGILKYEVPFPSKANGGFSTNELKQQLGQPPI